MADMTTTDEWLHRRILADIMPELARVDGKSTPAEVIHGVARKAAKTLGLADPYAEEKRRWIEETSGNADWIRSVVDGAPDPFAAALRLSIAANLIDCELRQEVVPGFSLRTLVETHAAAPLASGDVEDLRGAVDAAESILFVHDAAGELLFDRILIEKMGKPPERVWSVVRSAPALADATREEAEAVGLDRVARVIDPGIDCLGIPLNACSEEFRDCYRAAGLVVAKGQACYETLEGKEGEIDGERKTIFFLLRVKCPVMARHLGAAVGDLVLEAGG
jgi:uncharacterized protein with ATP-grasp and redox domains